MPVLIFMQPILTAFTGWFVIWMMIRLFFRNIIPKHKTAIATKLGTAAGTFFNVDTIVSQLNNPDALAGVMPSIEKHIDDFLRTRIQEKIPVIATFLGESTLKKLKEGLMEEIELLLPEVITQYAGNLSDKIKVDELIAAQINEIPAEKMERLLRAALGKELRQMQLVGAAIGLLIGIIAAAVSYLVQI